MTSSYDTFRQQILECKGEAKSRRGYISLPRFIKQYGGDRNILIKIALEAGLSLEKSHGRYGACVMYRLSALDRFEKEVAAEVARAELQMTRDARSLARMHQLNGWTVQQSADRIIDLLIADKRAR